MTSQITPSFATWSAPATRTARSPDTPTALSAARNVKSFIAVTVTANASDAMAAYKPKTHGKSKIASRKGAEMPKFYFTYGTDGQPFVGGWTEVEAPDRRAARAAFRSYHPDKTEGLLNCSSVYDEAWFKQTEMYRNGNFGVRCHERITLRREDANN